MATGSILCQRVRGLRQFKFQRAAADGALRPVGPNEHLRAFIARAIASAPDFLAARPGDALGLDAMRMDDFFAGRPPPPIVLSRGAAGPPPLLDPDDLIAPPPGPGGVDAQARAGFFAGFDRLTPPPAVAPAPSAAAPPLLDAPPLTPLSAAPTAPPPLSVLSPPPVTPVAPERRLTDALDSFFNPL